MQFERINNIFFSEKKFLALNVEDTFLKITIRFNKNKKILQGNVDENENLTQTCDLAWLTQKISFQYLTNREEHDRIARLWTKRYAT